MAPWLGLSFIRDMKRAGLTYENGNVLHPRDGKIYKAKMTLSADGQTLTMRGFIDNSLLGKDEVWNAPAGHRRWRRFIPSFIAKYLPVQAPPAKPPPAAAKAPAAVEEDHCFFSPQSTWRPRRRRVSTGTKPPRPT